MDNAPFRKQQSSIRFSILNDQSAIKTGGSSKLGTIGSSKKDLQPPKRGGLERKNHIDSKALDIMINELYNTLIALNTNFRDLFKKQKLKTPSKTTFNEILTQLLMLYDDNSAPVLSLSDEEIIQLFRDLGYPYSVRDDILKIIGAPHNWNHAVCMLHWLSQVIEAQGAGGEDLNLMSEGFNEYAEEESIFDMVRKGIENRVTAEELSRNYLSQQDTASDEHKVRTKLDTVENEIINLKREIQDCKKDQPALTEIKKQLSQAFEHIEKLRHQQAGVLQEITNTSSQSNEIALKLEAKKSHLSDLQLKREQVEDRIRNQLFDSETERRYIKEIKEQTSLLAGIRASTEKKHDLEAEIEGGIERDSTLITELKTQFKGLLDEVQKHANLSVSIDTSKDDYREIVDHVQDILSKELSSLRSRLQEAVGEEHLLKNQVEHTSSQNKELEAKLNDLSSTSKKLKDQMEIQNKAKLGREMAITSKKTTLMADIQSQNAQLAEEERYLEALRKEIEKADKETDRMKQLIRDHVSNSRDLLCKFKENHIDKIRSEADRVTYIKDGLAKYLKGKKKLN